jgi:hypothetical protein
MTTKVKDNQLVTTYELKSSQEVKSLIAGTYVTITKDANSNYVISLNITTT